LISLPSRELKTSKYVAKCLQLCVLLEVSAFKPGNVSREIGFETTRYEHFLASAVAVSSCFERAAKQGVSLSKEAIQPQQIGIGKLVKEAVIEVNAWQNGGNTLLGTILLLSPIAVAAGKSLISNTKLSIPKLRENIEIVVRSTTPSDAVDVYEAIKIADPNGLVGKAPALDVYDPTSKNKLLEEKISLYDVFKISSSYDSISYEWVETYPITFEVGLPYLTEQLKDKSTLNTAIVHTFLHILSKVPDTLIIRKTDQETADQISANAKTILEAGGLTTSDGREELLKLDARLRRSSNKLNPGTTADLMAAVLSLALLSGYRP
jgi:triphosphoribosyl-dephospho-CoA synthase